MKKAYLIAFMMLMVLLLLVNGCQKISDTVNNCRMETKYKTVNEKNCEYTSGCTCVGKSWGGLGSCNSCSCEYQEKVCD